MLEIFGLSILKTDRCLHGNQILSIFGAISGSDSKLAENLIGADDDLAFGKLQSDNPLPEGCN